MLKKKKREKWKVVVDVVYHRRVREKESEAPLPRRSFYFATNS